MVKRIAELVLLVVSFFIPNLVIAPFLGSSNLLESDLLLFVFSIAGLLQFFFMYGTVKITGNYTLDELGFIRPGVSSISSMLMISLGIIGIYVIFSVSISILPAGIREYLTSGYEWKLTSLASIPVILLFCLVTGYREEFLFRSYLLTALRNARSPLPVSVIVTTLLFGLLHSYEGIAAMIFAGMAGLYFSLVFVRSGNLHTIAIAHGIFNASILILSYFV